MRLSIIMPVYNEKATLLEILKRVNAVDLEKEVVIVDDGSTDGTREIIQSQVPQLYPQWKTLFHDVNRGKGAAIRTAIPHVTGDITLIQDADLEYDPDEFDKLIAPIRKGKATVVYGSRFTGEHTNSMLWHWVGNKMLTLITNILYDTTLSDMETCYKVFKTGILQGLTLRSNRFDIEPEMTAKILKQGIRIYEVPISYVGREYHEGKKIGWKDGVDALLTLIKYRFVD